jgi:uncharacterized SAM-dependent methyltransferase
MESSYKMTRSEIEDDLASTGFREKSTWGDIDFSFTLTLAEAI